MEKNKNLLIIEKAEENLKEQFKAIENIAIFNTKKVLSAFKKNNIALRHFTDSTGYGYADTSRIALSNLFKDIFKAEDAIVSPLIASGTHALTLGLFSVLRPNDTFLSISGMPYDTMVNVIEKEGIGSLKDFNISFEKVYLKNNDFNYELIEKRIKNKFYKVIFISRSKGYEWRNALSIEQIERVSKLIKKISRDSIIIVDNCYGEFVQKKEPLEVGADLIIGSLIKNPGGGIAPTGAYLAGRKDIVELVAYRLTAPGIGFEVGSYASSYRPFFQGIFFAPTTVLNALKGGMLFGKVFNQLGFETMPKINELPLDIVRSIKFTTEEEVIEFCQSIQKASPVDSHVLPMPWDMPGYTSKVIMASGSFVEGSSIELSCDAPIKEPYVAYLQGGLTYEHVKVALLECLERFLNKDEK